MMHCSYCNSEQEVTKKKKQIRCKRCGNLLSRAVNGKAVGQEIKQSRLTSTLSRPNLSHTGKLRKIFHGYWTKVYTLD